ncbi:MAG: hypothetical protein ISQ08_04135 [Planctomycetes bacterium]|nr:hypothetical protein [Planctomycetota bacterium]
MERVAQGLTRRELLLAATFAAAPAASEPRPRRAGFLTTARSGSGLSAAALALHDLREDPRCLRADDEAGLGGAVGSLELFDVEVDGDSRPASVWGRASLAEELLARAPTPWELVPGEPPGGFGSPGHPRRLALGVPTCGRSRPQRARELAGLVRAALETLPLPPEAGSHGLLQAPRRLRIGLLDTRGCGDAAVRAVRRALLDAPATQWLQLRHLDEVDLAAGELARVEVLLVPGGHAGVQARTLGTVGGAALTGWVRRGGAFLGICAGAYLGTSSPPWGLGLLPIEAHDLQHWRRGTGEITVIPTDAARRRLGLDPKGYRVRYANGPLLGSAPGVEVLMRFAGSLQGRAPEAAPLAGQGAWVQGRCGAGRVALLSPHLEATPGQEGLLGLAVRRLAGW